MTQKSLTSKIKWHNSIPLNEKESYINENRDKFIDDYEIAKNQNVTNPIRTKLNCFFYKKPENKTERDAFKYCYEYLNNPLVDHIQVFKTKQSQYVLLSSPYGRNNKERNNYYNNIGWEKINDLYNSYAETYVFVY
jgi:hypothetical protein